MKLNFEGRVNNVVLPCCRALQPLFEAVINSFHAIEDARRTDGRITVHIRRDLNQERQQPLIGNRAGSRRILGFSVEDNGVGFTTENYESFETSDTDHKKARGAKGVGRFLWLKAFDSVDVLSIYRENGNLQARSFTFSLSANGISNHTLVPASPQEARTVVELRSLKDKYEQDCPRIAQTVAERIIEHCLSYFFGRACPKVILQDDDEQAPIDLNELYRREIAAQTKRVSAKCGNIDLAIEHVRVFAGEFSHHTIHLCANGRDVQHVTLSSFIPYVPAKFKSLDGKLFVYKAYVSSAFLDQCVNAERTAFNLARDGELQSQNEPTEKALIDAVVTAASIELGPLLTDVEDRIKQRVEALVGSKYPEYRPILKEVDTYLREFRENADEKEILTKLNEIQFHEDLQAREQVQKLLSEGDDNVRRSQKYQELQKVYIEKANEIAQSRLAQCVIHRKIILDLLEAQVSSAPDGRFPKEEKIHQLIFPMRKTSDDVPWDRQNLWIIDERLAYHRFLASDKPIRSFSSNRGAGDEPDLFILNYPGVFVCGEAPVHSAVIVEFKRAEREDFNENPVLQVYRYVRKLRDQEIKDARGRTVPVHTNAVFYCYIVADLTPELRTMAEESSLDRTPDELGYFGYNRNFKAYVEILSYEKLLKDSGERNRELFRALHLDV